jgi:hypothetical protein
MRSVFPWLVILGLSIVVFVHYGSHFSKLEKLTTAQAKEQPEKDSNSVPAPGSTSDKLVTFVSPLQQLMGGTDSTASAADKSAQPQPLRKPNPADLIAPSPVGTGGVILHKTFTVSSAVNFPFIIPAHAATPQLHGHYQSFTNQDANGSEDGTDVGFLLMNESQYAEFIHRRPVDSLFSVDASHDQEINFGLPSSLSQPAKFYLVFRNPPGESKKIVKADFSVEF